MLPDVDPAFQAAVMRSAQKEKWYRRDWERHFSHRMDYDEYRFIVGLEFYVADGSMVPERARECLRAYREQRT